MTATQRDTGIRTPRSRRRWIAIFALASVIFGCGIVTGMGIMFRFMGPPMKLHQIPERAPEFITQSLRRDLGLDDDQAKAVLQIFKEDREKLEAIRVRVDAEVLAQMESSQGRIQQLLRPEQKTIFDKRFQKIKNQFRPGPSDTPAE